MILEDILRTWASKDFTLFYTATPPSAYETQEIEDSVQYEMDDSQLPLHLDLKRDLSIRPRANNITLPDGPLFERYQYFTPGTFAVCRLITRTISD